MAGWGSSGLPDATVEFTGERVVPGHVDEDLFNEHLSRYVFAKQFVQGRRVLDMGCGTGYGAALLAQAAEHVTGTDLSLEAIQYARDRYTGYAEGLANLAFVAADAAAPVGDSVFDVITAFEVIEHLTDWNGMLRSAREQLSPEGLLLVSTPNKPFYAQARGQIGQNPFHVHEFEFADFQEALKAVFPSVVIFVQNHSSGVLFSSLQPLGSTEVSGPATPPVAEEAHFFLAVCSLAPVENLHSFFWIPKAANLLRERDRHIAALTGEVKLKTQWMEAGRAELLARNKDFEQLLQMRQDVQSELEARNRWAAEQDRQLQERDSRIEELQREVEMAHANFGSTIAAYEERVRVLEETNRATVAWAKDTEHELIGCGQQLAESVALLDRAEKTVEERTLWAQGLDRELHEWQGRFNALRTQLWVRAGSRLRLVTDRLAVDSR